MSARTLYRRNLKKLLDENPTISDFEELCAFWGCEPSSVPEEVKVSAEKAINSHITRLRVKLKNELLASNNFKEHEMLYKLIGTEDEIKRLKSGDKTTISNNNNVRPTIEVKSSDKDILDKLNQL